jgi:large subunit ribosomal protein L28
MRRFFERPEKRKPMAQQCQFCGKIPRSGHRVSHANNVTNRKWHINLKSVRAAGPSGGKRVRACTRCIRSGKVTKPLARAAKPSAVAKS